MFTSIFHSLAAGIGQLMDLLITAFMNSLDLDLGVYLQVVPILGTVYSMIQAISIGLVAVVAGSGLASFWLGAFDAGEMRDRPISILIRALIAAMLVYFGGYILSFLVHLGSIPFRQFRDIAVGGGIDGGLAAAVLGGVAEMAIAPTIAVGDLAIALGELLLLTLLAFNLAKLALEVCERFMMTGLLVFTSPIIYPTLVKKESSQIFKKWCSMFISSLILMSASVLFLKFIVSGLANINAEATGEGASLSFFLRILLLLATCKIAMRVDTYLSQLGLNAAVTGGNLIDDMVALGRTMALTRTLARSGRHGGARSGSVLGGAPISARTPIGRGFKQAATDFASGKSVKDSVKSGARATGEAYKNNTAVGRGVKSAVDAAAKPGATPADVAKAGFAGAAVGGIKSGAGVVAPNIVGAHDANKAAANAADIEARREELTQRHAQNQAAVKDVRMEHNTGTAAMTTEEIERAQNIVSGAVRPPTMAQADSALTAKGVTDESGRTFSLNEEGDLALSHQAVNAGVSFAPEDTDGNSEGARFESVNPRSMGAFIAASASNNPDPLPIKGEDEYEDAYARDVNTAMKNTIQGLSPYEASYAITDPAYKLSGGDGSYAADIASHVFSDGCPAHMDRESARVTGISTENLGVSNDELGNSINGGRAYSVTYSDGVKDSVVKFYDPVAYSCLSDAEKEMMRKYHNAAGYEFYFEGSNGNNDSIMVEAKGQQRKAANIGRSSFIGNNKRHR